MNRKTILLVDDENQVREVVALTLDQGDFTIHQAQNGREAIELAEAHRPDLVLLDLSMPEMDGIEVCTALKANPSTARAKVIMLTARCSADDQVKALAAGADGFFSKPFSPLSLLNKVYETLG